jgi:hypothetical protein
VAWVKWKLISIRLDIVLISTQCRCMVCVKCAIGKKSLWAHSMELIGDLGQVEACFGPLETVLISVQDRCIVWDERTIGSKIVLGTLDGAPM